MTSKVLLALLIYGSALFTAQLAQAVSPSKSETFERRADGVEWKYLQFPQNRFRIDGERLYVCLKEFTPDAVNATCEDAKHRDRWVDSKSVRIDGFNFQRYEILYNQSHGDSISVNLIMRFKKAPLL
jgi:hypothetical protein